MQPNTKRISWIDAAKGLAIFFIVCGHCADKNGADRILLHFSMFTGVAVFFLLSGMTFCWKEAAFLYFDQRPFRSFLQGLVRGIVLPYICWSVISIVIYNVFGAAAAKILGSDRSHFALTENLAGMLYGNSGSGYMEWNRPLWFLTCLAVVELFWYLFFRKASRASGKPWKAYLMIAAVCTGSAAWLLYSNLRGIQLCLPWELETAFCVLPFFGLGRFIRAGTFRFETSFSRIVRTAVFVLSGLCAVLLWILLLGVADADFRADRFTQPLLFYPETVLGITAVLLFAKAVTRGYGIKLRGLLVYAGQRTMAILTMHKFAIMAEKVLVTRLNISVPDILGKCSADPSFKLFGLIVFDAASAICVVGLCLVAEHFLVRAVPFLFGKRK